MTDTHNQINKSLEETPNHSPWYCRIHTPWASLFEDCRQLVVKKNQIIYNQEDINKYVYYTHEGRIRLSIFNLEGNEKHLVIINPGNIFGSIFDKESVRTLTTATASADSILYYMHSDLFSQMILKNPKLSERLLLDLIQMQHILITHIKDISFLSAQELIINHLFHLANNYGVETAQGRKITIRFTHQEMADLTGTCRVTVSKIMKSLNKSGAVQKIDGFIHLLDEDYLKQMLCK